MMAQHLCVSTAVQVIVDARLLSYTDWHIQQVVPHAATGKSGSEMQEDFHPWANAAHLTVMPDAMPPMQSCTANI